MPARNSIKNYLPDSYYHVYNRGVEKRIIFLDEQDYSVFLSYIKTYLLPKDIKGLKAILQSEKSNYKEKDKIIKLLALNNFSDNIELVAYALLPNHFHFLLKQKDRNSIDLFFNSLGTRYTMYFNKKYHRVGKLYQGVYKAVLIKSDEQLLHLSRYIHLNPIKFLKKTVGEWEKISLPNSLPNYLGNRKTDWVKTGKILSYFKKSNPQSDYFSFVKEHHDSSSIATLGIDFDD